MSGITLNLSKDEALALVAHLQPRIDHDNNREGEMRDHDELVNVVEKARRQL